MPLGSDKTRIILDVRQPTEYLAHCIINATNLLLDYINKNINKISKNNSYFVHCADGFRSMIATSILKARGFHDLIDVQQGFKGIEATGTIPLTNYQCPTTIPSDVIECALEAVC